MSTEINPFKIKGVASGVSFYNRVEELKFLRDRIYSGQHTLLLAPRRYGKTSILEQLIKTVASDQHINIILIDLFTCTSFNEFIEKLGNQIIVAQKGTWEQISATLRKGLPKIAPFVSVGAQGEPELSIRFESSQKNIIHLENLLKWYDEKSKPLHKVIIFDEFQELLAYEDSLKIEKAMRAVIQKLKNTTIIFSGSQPTLLKKMFEDRTRPFFQSVLIKEINLTPIAEANKHLTQKLNKTGEPAPITLVNELAEISKGHPYYVQLCGFFAWEMYQSQLSWSKISSEAIFAQVIKQEQYNFELAISKLTTQQRKVYRAICREPDQPLTSHAFLSAHQLPSHSSVLKAVKSLEQLGYVCKTKHTYAPTDPMQAYWWKK